MHKIIYVLTLAFGTLFNCFGQTATVKVERLLFDNSYEKFDSIYFDFNGTKFWGKDTSTKTIKFNDNLDKCTAIIGKDTLHFFTKFQHGQEYVLRPGCCCSAFTLQARQNANRGIVTFKNNSEKDLGIVICEHNSDIVKKDSAKTIYASESAMCEFKPCNIQVVETAYFSENYNYKNDKRDYDNLWQEQATYVLSQLWFHFLHGEKIEIIFESHTKNIKLSINGQLAQNELDNL